jgi:histidine triad (HIT) family protein
MEQMDCVFCRIYAGKIPAKVVKRTDYGSAILDAFPLAPGHTLVISKSHLGKLQDLGSAELQGIFEMTGNVVYAVETAMGVASTTIAIHNGTEAGQEIPHVHVHIIPRRPGDGAGAVHSMFRQRPNSARLDMDSICSKIRSQLAGDQAIQK